MAESLKKRDAAKKQLISILKWANEADESSELEMVKSKLEKLESDYQQFLRHHDSITKLSGEAELPYQQIEFDSLMTFYENASARLAEIIGCIETQASPNAVNVTAAKDSDINISASLSATTNQDLVQHNSIRII